MIYELTSSCFMICSSGGSTIGAGSGAGADGVGVAGAACVGLGVDTRPGDAAAFSPFAPGFAGSDGCSSVGVPGGLRPSCDGADVELGIAGEAGELFAAAERFGVEAAPSLDAAACWAFARAWAMRSACLMSIFLRISIRMSSCLIFLTKSLTSPGLQRTFVNEYMQEGEQAGQDGTHWNGCCKSYKSR